MLDTTLWTQVRKIFDDVVLIPSKERREWLDQTCRELPDVRKEVELLLQSHDTLGRFLEPPEAPHGRIPDKTLLGKQIGPYRVGRVIGEGGMGAVYKAVRDYGNYQKPVAIKIVRGAVWNQETVQRFEQERETLARLQHPNIAQLLDGGTTDEGVPYVVMEYVEGVPLDTYCENERLDVAGRLALFRTICSAVHYAHQNLVVHRDLKPGNILIDASGTPKLLDFGIARIPDATPQDGQSGLTRPGLRFVTPEYASPEQLRNENITTKSDIYSLGIVLFKLLTGQRPYDTRNQLPHEIARTVSESSPLKPSTVVLRASIVKPNEAKPEPISSTLSSNPQQLSRRLSGDLDTIILKALEKDPEKRYGSVENFSEDIRRHLAGLPVYARSATFMYRTKKFILRHKVGAAAALTILLLLAGGIGAVLWQANKATKEAAKVEQINSFLQEMLASADPARSGKDVTVVQTLDRAVERIDNDLGAQPEIAASVLHTIGETYLGLGEYEKAERDLRKSLELRQRVYGNNAEEISTVLHSLAFLSQLRTQHAAADSLYQLSIAMHKTTAPRADAHLVSMLSDYSTLLGERNETGKRLTFIREALEISERIESKETRDYGILLTNYGSALHDNRQLAESDSIHRLGLAVLKKKLGENHIDVAQAINNFAMVLVSEEKNEEADSLFRQSLAIRKKVLGENHPEVALAMANLAGMLLKRGNLDEAGKFATESLRIYRTTVNPDNLRLSSSLVFLGRIANERGDASQAEKYLTEGLEIRKKTLPVTHYGVVATEAELGKTRILQKRYAEAERMLTSSYETLRTTMGENHATTTAALKYLVELYRAMGNENKANEFNAKLPTPDTAPR